MSNIIELLQDKGINPKVAELAIEEAKAGDFSRLARILKSFGDYNRKHIINVIEAVKDGQDFDTVIVEQLKAMHL